jgi:hypothetical protein
MNRLQKKFGKDNQKKNKKAIMIESDNDLEGFVVDDEEDFY